MYHIRQADKSAIPIWHKGQTKYVWEDKAGGYGIQTAFGAKAVKSIEGDFYNVMGLPISKISRILKEFGIEPGDQK